MTTSWWQMAKKTSGLKNSDLYNVNYKELLWHCALWSLNMFFNMSLNFFQSFQFMSEINKIKFNKIKFYH